MANGIPLVHPESGGEFLAVDEDQAAALARKGWQPAPDVSDAQSAPPAPPRTPRPAAATPPPEA